MSYMDLSDEDKKLAEFVLWKSRDFLRKLREQEDWKVKRNMLLINGYRLSAETTEDEVEILIYNIGRVTAKLRSGGIY